MLQARKVKVLARRKSERESNCLFYHQQHHNQHVLQSLSVKSFNVTPLTGPSMIQQTVPVGRKKSAWKR